MGSDDDEVAIVSIERIHGCRHCEPTQMDAVQLRNGLPNHDLIAVEFLVYGRFEEGENDDRGFFSTRWMSLKDLESSLDSVSVDAAIRSWEVASVEARERAIGAARRNFAPCSPEQ